MTNLIYKAISPSGRIYVGLTNNFKRRIHEHKRASKNKKHKDYNCAFHAAIRKHGFENIKWEILEYNISDELIKVKEIQWIEKLNSYKNGYNETLGGDRGLLGYKHSDKTKKKIANRFYPKGQYDPRFGKKRSEEIIKKIKDNHADFSGDKHPRFRKDINKKDLLECLSNVGQVSKVLKIFNISKSTFYKRIK